MQPGAAAGAGPADGPARAVLVVGGSSGIGLATALHLSRLGDRIALLSRDGDALSAAAAACRSAGSPEVITLPADVTDEQAVHAAVATVAATFGRLDAVVHTATVMAYGTVEAMPSDVFRTVVDTAVHGTLFLAQAVLARFREQGSGTYVVVNSLLGSVTVPEMGAYATAKWGQRAIARTLQQEVRALPGIHVCIVSPGSTNTPIYYQAANYTGRSARPPVPVLQPERIATSIAGLLTHPRKHVSVPVGPTNPVIVSGFRLLPFVYDRIVRAAFRLAALTRHREGPNAGNVRTPNAADEAMTGHWPRR